MDHRNQGYYCSPRADIVDLVPDTALRILDVGCGEGKVGALLKAGKPDRYVVGIELDEEAARLARLRLDKVYEVDVQTAKLDELPGSFDCLIYGDILEHTKDPLAILRNHRSLLRRNGRLIVSIPNVQFYYVILCLLRGRWTYTNRGIFDRSHLRYFTLYEIRNLLAHAGYCVAKVERNYRLLERPSRVNKAATVFAWLPLMRPFLTYQYVLLARKQED
jgi:O-antigen biosynthesis protein